MNTKDLFEKLQNAIILDLKEDETPCPKCKGLRFYYVEENGKGYVETCRECHTGKLYTCECCQTPNKTNYCNCKNSWKARSEKADAKHYEKAEKLTPEQYDGWVYWEELGYNEGYFQSVDDLIEWCEDESAWVPDWVYCCKEEKHSLDIDSAIENMLEDAYEDARDALIGEKELHDYVEKWNARQTVTSYYPDYKRVVVLKEVDHD